MVPVPWFPHKKHGKIYREIILKCGVVDPHHLMWIRMRMHIRVITLLRIQIFILCGSGFLFYAGPDLDPTFHSDQDQDPSLQIKAQTHEKSLNRLILHTFWLVICKLMRIWIQLITSMEIRTVICYLMRDPDAVLGYQNDADPDPDPKHC